MRFYVVVDVDVVVCFYIVTLFIGEEQLCMEIMLFVETIVVLLSHISIMV